MRSGLWLAVVGMMLACSRPSARDSADKGPKSSEEPGATSSANPEWGQDSAASTEGATKGTKMEPSLPEDLNEAISAIATDPIQVIGMGEKSFQPYVVTGLARRLITADEPEVTQRLAAEARAKSADRVYRLVMLHILALRDDPKVDQHLIDALQDPALRAISAFSLGRIGYKVSWLPSSSAAESLRNPSGVAGPGQRAWTAAMLSRLRSLVRRFRGFSSAITTTSTEARSTRSPRPRARRSCVHRFRPRERTRHVSDSLAAFAATAWITSSATMPLIPINRAFPAIAVAGSRSVI
jgi:hypothetical protein